MCSSGATPELLVGQPLQAEEGCVDCATAFLHCSLSAESGSLRPSRALTHLSSTQLPPLRCPVTKVPPRCRVTKVGRFPRGDTLLYAMSINHACAPPVLSERPLRTWEVSAHEGRTGVESPCCRGKAPVLLLATNTVFKKISVKYVRLSNYR